MSPVLWPWLRVAGRIVDDNAEPRGFNWPLGAAMFGTDQPWLSLLDTGDMVRYRRNSLSIGTAPGC